MANDSFMNIDGEYYHLAGGMIREIGMTGYRVHFEAVKNK